MRQMQCENSQILTSSSASQASLFKMNRAEGGGVGDERNTKAKPRTKTVRCEIFLCQEKIKKLQLARLGLKIKKRDMIMPSKKKQKKKKKSSRGKARKGDNRKKKEEPIDAQRRLKIDDDSNDEVALLEKSIKLATAEKEALDADAAVGCSHRPVVPAHDRFIIKDFANTFADGYKSVDAE
eukprot:scaffold15997_cov157-Skeletonema_dohrnii-CCMP3373.AAC.3